MQRLVCDFSEEKLQTLFCDRILDGDSQVNVSQNMEKMSKALMLAFKKYLNNSLFILMILMCIQEKYNKHIRPMISLIFLLWVRLSCNNEKC